MNESAKKIYTSINKLRCNLHFLLGLADAAEKGLNEYDKNVGVIGPEVRIQKHIESGPTKQLGQSAKHFRNMDLNKLVSCHILQYISEILLSN